MKKHCLALLLLAAAAPLAAQRPASEIIDMARRGDAGLHQALVDTLEARAVKEGSAAIGYGEDFIFVVESPHEPKLMIGEKPGPEMVQLQDSSLWYATAKLKTGTSHQFGYIMNGKPFGGNLNVAAYGPDSYPQRGVPQGKLSEQLLHVSKSIYPGLRSNYWIYVPAQYNQGTPAALMVWQDGHQYIERDGRVRLLDVVDNLTQQKKIPVMIHVLISPGDITQAPDSETHKQVTEQVEDRNRRAVAAGRPPGDPAQMMRTVMRSIQYDTVSDRYARFLRDEVLAEVGAKYNLRKDGYSRAISGHSSGGICAFNVAWQQPDQFARVLSWDGSFVALQPEPNYGGQAFPAMVQREDKRNIRVWLQDGADDNVGWPEQNIQLANSLKRASYDFHFTYGGGSHHQAQGSAELPQSLIWLWRDYDAAKTGQEFAQSKAEQEKPYFRFKIHNRDHGANY
jgi:enterochelin esterase family protein